MGVAMIEDTKRKYATIIEVNMAAVSVGFKVLRPLRNVPIPTHSYTRID
jgi:hypothetical protein